MSTLQRPPMDSQEAIERLRRDRQRLVDIVDTLAYGFPAEQKLHGLSCGCEWCELIRHARETLETIK